MKTVEDLIKELENLPQDMPVYHFDMKDNFSFPKIDIAETNIEGDVYRYVMISSSETKEDKKNSPFAEEEIID